MRMIEVWPGPDGRLLSVWVNVGRVKVRLFIRQQCGWLSVRLLWKRRYLEVAALRYAALQLWW